MQQSSKTLHSSWNIACIRPLDLNIKRAFTRYRENTVGMEFLWFLIIQRKGKNTVSSIMMDSRRNATPVDSHPTSYNNTSSMIIQIIWGQGLSWVYVNYVEKTQEIYACIMWSLWNHSKRTMNGTLLCWLSVARHLQFVQTVMPWLRNNWKTMINGKPYTSRGVRTVSGRGYGNLPW